ncbi:hypothetical protein DMO17_19420 [Aquipseudomonas alcaligenes]|uniref:Phage tail assembly chaperone-like domain-containing protein n=1 Tax=Aquipseudomonas alcaligenes TaxID=43263 RepID=A0A2V4KGN9_AQUAC|nr:phage tail assembly chaperone [Pseudomonas alcaligenes]PYC19548.1 hypothetical protein DMO17_19420 [Pseudomonas alcaligenes]
MKKFFFCPETLGLYPGAPYGDAAGKDCIELTEAEYRALAGHALALDAAGRPVLVASLPLTVEQLEAAERGWRDYELRRSEWLIARHRDEVDMVTTTTLSVEQYGELLAWRQLLRDWPASRAFPDDSGRPVPPAWLASLT